jgi:hypothetical protein
MNFSSTNSSAQKVGALDVAIAACLAIALLLWLVSLQSADPERLDDLGLVSILPWQYWLALFLIAIGFSFSLHSASRLHLLRPAALVTLVLLLHATPAIVYGTLRYSWAWKHIGIVDYIQRHGTVDLTAPFLAAYHNWPGFFWLSAVVADWFDLGPLQIADLARYYSVVSSLIFIVLLKSIFSRFTNDLRLQWGAIWIFLCANWVGQDYYSPQAFVYVFYLIVIALCLGPLMPRGRMAQTGIGKKLGEFRALFTGGTPRLPQVTSSQRILATLAVFVCILAIIASHQLTPIILICSLLALVVMTPLSVGYPLLATLSLVYWIVYPAAPFTAMYLPGEVAALGDTLGGVTDKFVDTSSVSMDVALVAWAGRTLVAAVGGMAVLGWLRRLSVGARDGVVCALLGAPLPVLLVTSYGGEAIFRIYFFCLPFLAFFAASLIFVSNTAGRRLTTNIAFSILATVFAVGFLLGNNGKDKQYRFSREEVVAANWVYSRGGPGTLLVEGARSYPSQFANYENFTYLPIANERPEEIQKILKDPAGVMFRWFQEPAWKNGYVIVTNSQKAYVEALDKMPEGALDNLVQHLAESPDFQLVFANRDAVVYQASRFLKAESSD